MTMIKIDISNVESTLKSMKLTQKTVTTTKENFLSSANKIDYEIRKQVGSSGASIGTSISTINNKLNSIDNKLKNIEKVISFATTKYTQTENKVIKNSSLFEVKVSELTNPEVKGENPHRGNGRKINYIKDNGANINETDVEERGILNKITAFFEDVFKGFANDAKDEAIDITSDIYTGGIEEFVEWAKGENFQTLLDPNPNSDRVLIDSEFINKIDNIGKFSEEFFGNLGFFSLGLDYGGLIIEALESEQGFWKTASEIVVETIPFVLKFTGAAILGLCGVTFGLSGIAAIAATAVSAFALTWVSDKVVDFIFNDDVKDYLKNDFEQTVTGAIDLVKDGTQLIGNAVGIT